MTGSEFHQRQLSRLQQQESAATERLVEATQRALGNYKGEKARIEAEREKADREKDDPIVMVHTTTWRHFHDSVYPCGRVTGENRRLSNFVDMTLTAAESKGLKPCSACGMRAQNRRPTPETA